MQESKPKNKLKVSSKVKSKVHPKARSEERLKSNLRSQSQLPSQLRSTQSPQLQPRNASSSSQVSLLPKDDLNAKRYFIEIKDYVNMGNHLHIKARFKDIKSFQNFLRVFTGVLARKLTKANRGSVFGKFWDGLTYTRVLLSKFEELGLRGYFEANHRQRELGYHERERYLKSWNQFICNLKMASKGPEPVVHL